MWLLALVAITIAGLVLRVAWLSRESLWGDEVFSRDLALQTYGSSLQRVRADVVHPPLYYLALNTFTRLSGASPLALRWPSVVFGCLTIVAFAVALRRLVGRRDVPLVAAALLAISQLQIYYSQEIRSYALYELLTVLMIWAVIEAVVQRIDRRRWIAFALLASAVVLTHNVGVFFVMATLLAPVVGGSGLVRRGLLARWFLAVVPAALLSLSWTAYVVPAMRARHGLGENLGWIAKPGALEWADLFANFIGVLPVKHAIPLASALSALLVGVAVLFTLRAPGASRTSPTSINATITGMEQRRVAVYTLLACALVPPTVLLVLSNSNAGVSFWGARHLLPAAACWIALVAIGICTLAERSLPAGALATVVMFAPGLLAARTLPRVPLRVPYDRVAVVLSQPANRKVPVFTTATWNVGAPTNHYLTGRDTILPLPNSAQATLPTVFWLAYRPFVASEAASVALIRKQGWTGADSLEFGTTPKADAGVYLIRFERASTPASARVR